MRRSLLLLLLAAVAAVTAHSHGSVHPLERHHRALAARAAYKTSPKTPHGGCGVGSHTSQVFDHHSMTSVPQHYTEKPHLRMQPAELRRLQLQTAQSYAGAGFMSPSAADEAGLTGGLRLGVVWDLVEGLDTQSQCRTVGQVSGTGVTCTDADIVTPEKLAIVRKRFNYTTNYLHDLLRVKPVQDSITTEETYTDAVSTYDIDLSGLPSRTFEDVDLVVIMTMHPHPSGLLAGYAYCRQTDQYGRCTVGVFNWCPNVIDVAGTETTNTISGERRTAIHEVTHLLGGITVGRHMIGDDGTPLIEYDGLVPTDTSAVYVRELDSEAYDKPVVKVVTPRVVSIIRRHFDCANLTGMPLEDQPIGASSHWEARLMGPEVMSYGTGSGEQFMSELTLAFLEDTGQFVANYSVAGPLVAPTAFDFGEGELSFLSDGDSDTTAETVGDRVERMGGELRLGRGAGCAFVQSGVDAWDEVSFPSTSSRRYTCDPDEQEFGCTFDNRMSAVCNVETVSPAQAFSCVRLPEEGVEACQTNANFAAGQLPDMYQYFEGQPAKGGFNDAMDYVPVRLGYWNCQDRSAVEAESTFAEAGMSMDFGSLFAGATADMQEIGGQGFCPECRCFESSLMELGSGSVNPNFPRYGLCYRANCYAEDALQFAIKGQLGGVFWYGCPPEGGKLYIPGYSGAIHCPEAKSFCRFETISGVRFTETDRFKEFAFWLVVVGLPCLFFMLFMLSPDFRDRMKRCIKGDEELNKFIPRRDPQMVVETQTRLKMVTFSAAISGAMLILFAIQISAGGSAADASPAFIALGSAILLFELIGWIGSHMDNRLLLLLFFYVSLAVIVGLTMFVVGVLAFRDVLQDQMLSNWAAFKASFPNVIPANSNATLEVEQEIARDYLSRNFYFLGAFGLVAIIICIISVYLAGKLLTWHYVSGGLVLIINMAILITSMGMIYMSTQALGIVDAEWAWAAYLAITTAAYVTLVSLVGLGAMATRSIKGMRVYVVMLGFMTLALVVFIIAITLWSPVLISRINNMTDRELADVVQGLGVSGAFSKEEIVLTIENNMRYLILICVLLLCAVIISLGGAILQIKTWTEAHTAAESAHSMQLARRRRKAGKRARKKKRRSSSASSSKSSRSSSKMSSKSSKMSSKSSDLRRVVPV